MLLRKCTFDLTAREIDNDDVRRFAIESANGQRVLYGRYIDYEKMG